MDVERGSKRERKTRETLPGDDAERTLNELIERRSQEREEAEREAAALAERVARLDARAAADNRLAWIEYHRALAEFFAGLAEEHRREAGRLVNGGAG